MAWRVYIVITLQRFQLDIKSGHYRTLIGSHTSRVEGNRRRAAPMTGSARNGLLVSFDFGRRQLNGDTVMTPVFS